MLKKAIWCVLLTTLTPLVAAAAIFQATGGVITIIQGGKLTILVTEWDKTTYGGGSSPEGMPRDVPVQLVVEKSCHGIVSAWRPGEKCSFEISRKPLDIDRMPLVFGAYISEITGVINKNRGERVEIVPGIVAPLDIRFPRSTTTGGLQ